MTFDSDFSKILPKYLVGFNLLVLLLLESKIKCREDLLENVAHSLSAF